MKKIFLNTLFAAITLLIAGCISAPKIPDRDPAFDRTATDNALPESAYPTQSRRLGEEGKVVLAILIHEDGSTTKVQLLKSSGFERLDKAAIDWYEHHGKFLPGIRDGKPVIMWKTLAVNFTLKKPETTPTGN